MGINGDYFPAIWRVCLKIGPILKNLEDNQIKMLNDPV